jgi:hypothetical protein
MHVAVRHEFVHQVSERVAGTEFKEFESRLKGDG